MRTVRRFTISIATGAIALGPAMGCGWGRDERAIPQTDYIPPSTQIANEIPIRSNVEPRPVKTGTLPLVYLLDFPGELRVVNTTTGRVLLTTRAGGRTILSVEDDGITIGGRKVSDVRLNPAHQYAIYLNQGGENVNRNVYERR